MGICWTNIINSMTFIVSIGSWQNLQTYCFVCQSRYKVNSWHAPLMDTYYKWSCPSQGYLHFKESYLELLMSWPLSWRETSSVFQIFQATSEQMQACHLRTMTGWHCLHRSSRDGFHYYISVIDWFQKQVLSNNLEHLFFFRWKTGYKFPTLNWI